MRIVDRYDSAIRTSDLRLKANPDDTIIEHSDVLGAFGFAGHKGRYRDDGSERSNSPLAVALTRLLSGDNHAAADIVEILADQAQGKARYAKVIVSRTVAVDMGRAVLAWYRNGACRACNGHGYDLIPGAPAISGNLCQACDGTRKVPFGLEFSEPVRVVAFWLLAEVEREQSKAGPAAMANLVERMP